MRLVRILWLSVFIVLSGCGGSDDSKIVGDWRGKFVQNDGKTIPGANLSFDKEHHFREVFKNLDVEGTWSLSGTTLTMRTEKLGGKTVEDARKAMLASAARSSNPAAAKSMAENLDKPIQLSISSDGKTLKSLDDKLASGHAEFTKQ
jgi:hypothetical protein